MFDDDAIREQLKLPRTAADAVVEREIRRGCRAPDRLAVVLLKRNMESVIVAAAACDPGIDPKWIERAVKHKELLARDTILTECSRERARPLRDCMLGKVPSLQLLVDLLCRTLLPGNAVEAPPPVDAGARGRKRTKSKK